MSPVWCLLNIIVVVYTCYILLSFSDEDVSLKHFHKIDELLSMTRGYHDGETRARVSLRQKPHKEQRYWAMCLDHHLCFPVFFMPRQNPTTRKGYHRENTRCQNIDASTWTEDAWRRCKRQTCRCTSYGPHVQTTSQSATQATAKAEKVWRPTISSARSSK